jgi:hypothetical protein
MLIQYGYALITMVPCPVWFWYRWASASFLMVVFTWATYNGATFYIDVFGRRMEKEFEALKKEVTKWQNMPESRTISEESDSASQKPTQHHSEAVEGIDPKQGTTAREETTNTEGVRQR